MKWGICINQRGWLMDEELEVLTYDSQEEAIGALKHMKRDKRYSWNAPIEVKEFTGLPDEKE